MGYTGIRIRGSDQTRINVTVNGIPINDSESQGVFWINMPDLATSLSSAQIQRGLGSSTNGSGAFGASINLETSQISSEPAGLISNSFGSFNTMKNTVQYASGRQKNGFAFEGRLSNIQSDGYIDRASSKLQSYYLNAGYFGEKTIIKAISFAGSERTYQSWYGTPESRVEGDVQGMLDFASSEGLNEAQTENLLNSGRTYNFYTYDNEVDDYDQAHYQLHLLRELNPDLTLSLAGHYTHGEGFFEQFRDDDDFMATYGKPYPVIGNETIESGDFIRRRWLDNDFFGATYALTYEKDRHRLIFGGGLHFYRGDHFGEIVWAEVSPTIDHLERYYEGIGDKDDHSAYAKWEYNMGQWNFMADMQVRSVNYSASGIDNDLQSIDVMRDFLFFNPKAGVRYNLDDQNGLYVYFGRGNREPVRSDFIDSPAGEAPKHETLNNLEIGYTYTASQFLLNANGYLMAYENQLVLTGELNDVGSSVRRNVDESYRIGLEIDATYRFSKLLSWNANATFSQNKIRDFSEVVYDYSSDDFGVVENSFSETDISFSPSIIAASRLNFTPIKRMEVNLISKYVGEQFLDNTQSDSRKLDDYFVNDLRFAYSIQNKVFKEIQLSLLVNNIFDAIYSSNGYSYSYIVDELVTQNFYYPQAGTNFLVGLNLSF